MSFQWLLTALCSSLLFIILTPLVVPSEVVREIKIGVLAYRGKEEAIRRWSPTADYLTLSMPGSRFTVVPLDFNEIGPATRDGRIDFIITNTSIYVELEYAYGISRIATLKNRWKDRGYTVFGGVIFTRSDRDDIKGLRDLKGKTFMAVDETSLGGWRMAWREMKDRGINPYRDLKDLRFGTTHDRVVMAVLKGEVDAGTVRTDIIERMAERGLINPKDIKVINEQKLEGFPFLLSTRLYPEWPFAKLRHVPEELSERVAIALLSMPIQSVAAISSESAGWTVPLDYYPVHELMKELKVGPYKDYGKVTFLSFVRQYWYLILLTIGIIAILTALVIKITRLNKRLIESKLRIQHALEGLEVLVKERTAELENKNRELTLEIEKRKRTEEEIIKAKEEMESHRRFLQSILDSIPDQIMVIRPDFKVEFANTSLTNELKAGDPCYRVSHGKDLPCDGSEHPCPLKEVIKGRRKVRMTHKHLRSDGSDMIVEIVASPVFDEKGEIACVIELSRDITERVRLEEEHKRLMDRLYIEEKEQSIVTLAGGIAHDFNNMLMATLGSAELLRMRARSEDLPYIESIINSSERMADLVRQMLAYAGQGKYQPSNINLNELVTGALKMTHKGKYLSIGVNLDLEDNLWLVFADRSQMEQMLVNLILNAFEAMEETGGSLSIKTSNINMTSPMKCGLFDHNLLKGEYVQITVKDTGPGIPKDLHRKVFEPFFTTRFMGRGLGLPAVAGIVKSHNGCILLESEEGKGATFIIYLPRAAELVQEEVEPSQKGSGKGILVADDESTILSLIEETLSGAGFNVYTARDGQRAIDMFRDIKDVVDVAIIDIEMPEMDGKKLISELKGLSKDLKILVSSGYDEDFALSGLDLKPDAFIQKPYRLSFLLSKVKELLR